MHEQSYCLADPYPYTMAKTGSMKLHKSCQNFSVMKSKGLRVADPGKNSEVPAGMQPGQYNCAEDNPFGSNRLTQVHVKKPEDESGPICPLPVVSSPFG